VTGLKIRASAVVFLVLIGIFCGSLGTMLWIGPDFFEKAGINVPLPSTTTVNGETSIQKIEKTIQLLEENYIGKVDREKLLNGALNGVVDSLEDPYTVYMDVDQSSSFHDSIESSFEGIGAEVQKVDGKVRIVAPIKGSPAEKAGIRANDFIISVNGESLEKLELFEAVKKIRGPKGTQAKLKIERAGLKAPIEIIVVRDEIPIETVYAEMLQDKVGYIQISQFSMNTAEHFEKELNKLDEKGMTALIVDVRNNPGGLLPSVVQILENFVPKDEVLVQVKSRGVDPELYFSQGMGKEYPIVVLINEGSASASEIMAAALRETINSKLVGVKSFGKGSVQNTFEEEMADGSNLKITVAKWLTPKGNTIDKVGVKPDIEVKQPAFFSINRLTMENTLQFDMVSDDVKTAQLMLAGLQLYKGRTDGYFDRATEQAVKAFQKDNALNVSGKIDKQTGKVLEEQVIQFIQDKTNDEQLKQAIKTVKEMIK
jgi:carboxyl-terminal processing protease